MKHVTSRKEYDDMTRDNIIKGEDCPFCHKNISPDRVIWRGKYWCILRNLFPYSGDADHLMAIPCSHKVYARELSEEEFLELRVVHIFMKEYFGEKEYFSSTRETLSNRSIEHYHMHFIPGRLQGAYLRKMLQHQGFPIEEDISID